MDWRTAVAAGICALVLPGWAAAQEPADPSAADIEASERALAEAMHQRNRARIEQLLAPDFVLRGVPDIPRTTWIENAVTLCWGDRSDIDHYQARRHDEVIVASFELTFYVDPVTCGPAVLRSLITDVWTRQPAGWRLQVRHAGPAQPSTDVAAQYGSVPLPPPTWELSSELSLVATGGNTSTRTFGSGGNVIHRAGPATTQAAVAFLTSEADNVTKARSVTAEARHAVRLGARVSLFGEGTYARDRFAGIDGRGTAAFGAGYTTTRSRRHVLTTEGSLGFTIEQRRDATELRFATAKGGLDYVWTFAPGARLSEAAALTSDLETAGNWRATSRTELSVTLTRLLSLKASHAFEYRNRPVPGFERMDTRTAAALVFAFQRRPAIR